MGNSASTSIITSAPRKLRCGHKREDTVKLEDFLTKCEEDLWAVKAKRGLGVKKVYVAHSVRYRNLGGQQSDGCFPPGGEMPNPAFVGDQGLWGGPTVHCGQSKLNAGKLSKAALCEKCTWAQLFKRPPFSPRESRCEARLAPWMCERSLSSFYKKKVWGCCFVLLSIPLHSVNRANKQQSTHAHTWHQRVTLLSACIDWEGKSHLYVSEPWVQMD